MTTPARPDEAPVTAGLVESLPAIVWEADPATSTMTYVSARSVDLVGHPPDSWLASGTFWEEHVHPDDLTAALEAVNAVIAAGGTTQITYRFQAADGEWRWFQDAISVSRRADGSVRLGGVMLPLAEAPAKADADADDRAIGRAAAASLDGEIPLHRRIVDNLGDGVYYVDRNRRITYWNHGAERLTGYDSNGVVGRLCSDNLLCHVDGAGRNLCTGGCPLQATIRDGATRDVIAWLRHRDGSRRPVHVRTAPLREGNDDGEIVGAVEIFSDATGLIEARTVAEQALADAMTDPVTGVPTRRLLDAVLTARQDDLNRHSLPYGLLLVDIDDMTAFTRFGTEVGNQVLAVTAATLKGGLRGGDTLVRWAAGQFAIVGAQVDGAALARLAERQLHLVRNAQVPVPGGRLPIRVSIGGGLARPREARDALVRRANDALLAARAGGGDRFILNDPVHVSRQPRLLGVRAPEARDEVGTWR